jgi:hypothetical protein
MAFIYAQNAQQVLCQVHLVKYKPTHIYHNTNFKYIKHAEIRATDEISVISPETATHKHRTVILEMVSMVPHTTHSLTHSHITLNKNFHIYRKDWEQNPF